MDTIYKRLNDAGFDSKPFLFEGKICYSIQISSTDEINMIKKHLNDNELNFQVLNNNVFWSDIEFEDYEELIDMTWGDD